MGSQTEVFCRTNRLKITFSPHQACGKLGTFPQLKGEQKAKPRNPTDARIDNAPAPQRGAGGRKRYKPTDDPQNALNALKPPKKRPKN